MKFCSNPPAAKPNQSVLHYTNLTMHDCKNPSGLPWHELCGLPVSPSSPQYGPQFLKLFLKLWPNIFCFKKKLGQINFFFSQVFKLCCLIGVNTLVLGLPKAMQTTRTRLVSALVGVNAVYQRRQVCCDGAVKHNFLQLLLLLWEQWTAAVSQPLGITGQCSQAWNRLEYAVKLYHITVFAFTTSELSTS